MKHTSKTGLTASPTKKIQKNIKVSTVQLCAIARPAPFVLKRFAGLYNPYPYGCSLLCNHPTDTEAKELLKKAKDSWATDGRNVLLADEIAAIRAGLAQIQSSGNILSPLNQVPAIESVPEELFRRYTETDSRPLTPAPTLASGTTRASGSRRCITPDPFPTNQIREKTMLILDLRRSHSQETLSYCNSSSLQEPPLIRIHHISGSFEEIKHEETIQPNNLLVPQVDTNSKSFKPPPLENPTEIPVKDAPVEEEDEDEFVKRRGKRRRKKGRDASRGPPAFQASLDPETQVATVGGDSHNPSARPSLVPDVAPSATEEKKPLRPSASLDIDSYLNSEILRQLRRELNEEIVDNELNRNRRLALEEALKTVSKNKRDCEELVNLQRSLNLPKLNVDLWLSLPRTFTRSSATFELPMNSISLSYLTPIDYIKEHVNITKSRKLLYNCVFNKYKMECDIDLEPQRKLLGNIIQTALNVMMGKPMTEVQADDFRNLFGWKDDDEMDFKTFCGLCAVCERLLAPEFCPQLPDRKSDPCHELETADFEGLTRKLHGQTVDPRLSLILIAIKTL